MFTLVVTVVDLSEKIDDFLEHKIPLGAILTDYYGNFLPSITFMVFPIYVFITVVFFTSKLAGRSELLALLAAGVSFYRIFFIPYLFCAFLLFLLQLAGNHYLIPISYQGLSNFEEVYQHKNRLTRQENYHIQVKPGIYYGLETFNFANNTGRNFSIEVIENKQIVKKLNAKTINYDEQKETWVLKDYYVREVSGKEEQLTSGSRMDTALLFKKSDITTKTNLKELMTTPQLTKYIVEESQKGRSNMEFFVVEKYRRNALPFATFILTLLGYSLASRKSRGGMGWHILLAIGLSALFILLLQFTTTFATKGNLNPLLAVWMPNILFAIISLILLRAAPK